MLMYVRVDFLKDSIESKRIPYIPRRTPEEEQTDKQMWRDDVKSKNSCLDVVCAL